MMSSTKKYAIVGLVLSIIISFIYLWMVRNRLPDGCENSQDSYFHVTMADLGPSFFSRQSFPHMTMSIWNGAYSDREFLYHLCLSGIRSWQHLIGMKVTPPFHVPALFFAFFAVGSFVATACILRFRHLWFWTFLFVLISPYLTDRLLMVRPHVWSISLSMLMCALLSRIDKIKHLWFVFLGGFIMAWSYSNPHFIMIPAFCFGFFHYFQNRKLGIGIPVAVFMGLIAGMIIHPQCPNTFYIWKVQCFDAVVQIVTSNVPVFQGGELQGVNMRSLTKNACVLLIFSLLWIIIVTMFAKKIRIPRNILALSVLSLIWLGLTLFSERSFEYAVPATILSFGALSEYALRVTRCRFPSKHPLLIALLAGTVIFTLAVYNWSSLSTGRSIRIRALPEFAAWAEKVNLPSGIVIANINWSDFPLLFYSVPQYRFLHGLDPMFSYMAYPEKIRKLERFRTGVDLSMTPGQLAMLTHAQFAFVSYQGWKLAKAMSKKGYPIVYQGPDGWLFNLLHNKNQSIINPKKTRER